MNMFSKRKAIKELQAETQRQKIQIDFLYSEVWKLKNALIKKNLTEEEINEVLNQ